MQSYGPEVKDPQRLRSVLQQWSEVTGSRDIKLINGDAIDEWAPRMWGLIGRRGWPGGGGAFP